MVWVQFIMLIILILTILGTGYLTNKRMRDFHRKLLDIQDRHIKSMKGEKPKKKGDE